MEQSAFRQEQIASLRAAIRYLYRPEDRLLYYVQSRVQLLAELGVTAPWARGRGMLDRRDDNA